MSSHNYVETHLTGPGVTGWTMRCGVFRAINVRKADRFGKSDPYAVLFVNGIRRAKTKVIKKTLNPHWNQVIEIALTTDDLGASSLQASSMTLAVYDMDKVGTHDFLGAVELKGDKFMNFAAAPMTTMPVWEVTDTSRIQERPLANVAPHPKADVRGKLAFWAEIKLDQESARLLAAIKIQALKRGNDHREVASRIEAARNIQKIRRAQNGRRKFEKTEFAYMAFNIAVSHLKRWVQWNNLTLEKVFEDLDYDDSGELTMAEIRQFFKTHPSVDLSEADINALVFNLDPNGDGITTMEEFLDAVINCDEVTDSIKGRWKNHLKQRDIMQRVKDMGRAWLKGSKNKTTTIGNTLQGSRRRRNSRWSAEFELMKAMAEQTHKDHHHKKLTNAERADSLHKGWRRESARRIDSHAARRKKLQLKLLTEHSAYLHRDTEEDDIEGGETFGLGDEGELYYDESYPHGGGGPRRPAVNKQGPASTSPNAARRSKNSKQPKSPNEMMKLFNYWERMVDKKTKRVFFCNCNTKEVQWKLPRDGKIWPPPPPEEKEEEPRISPFAEFRKQDLSPNNQSDIKANRRNNYGEKNWIKRVSFNSTSPKSRKELDQIAYQMENFGSFRYGDLRIPSFDEDYNDNDEGGYYDMYKNDGYDNDEYYDDDSTGPGSSSNEQYGSGKMLASPKVKLTPKQRREQERLTKEENTKTANKVITDESQHMKNRIDNRHVQIQVENKRHKHMEDRLNKRKQSTVAETVDPAAFKLTAKEESLRPYLVMVTQELNREAHHVAPTKMELIKMKKMFMELAEVIPDKATLTKHQLFQNVKKIADESDEKKVKKYAIAVVSHWTEVFGM